MQQANTRPSNNSLQVVVYCPKHKFCMDHLCVAPACPRRSILCSGCYNESHQGHQVCSLIEFYSYASNFGFDKAVEKKLEETMLQLKTFKVDFANQIEESRTKLNQLQTATDRYFRDIETTLDREVEAYTQLKAAQFIYNPDQEPSAFYLDMTNQINRLLSTRQTKKSLVLKLEQLLNVVRNTHAERIQFLERLKSDVARIASSTKSEDVFKSWDQILSSQLTNTDPTRKPGTANTPMTPMLLSNQNQQRPDKPTGHQRISIQNITSSGSTNGSITLVTLHQWSSAPRSKDIIEQNQGILRQSMTKEVFVGSLINKVLASNSIFTWKLQIGEIKSNGSMLVGICEQKLLAKNGVQFPTRTYTGHGCYLISSNGKLFHSDDSNRNESTVSFTFKKNDILEMQYSPYDNQLRVAKGNGSEIFKIKGITKKEDRPLRAVVFLQNRGDYLYLLDKDKV